jgi:hypothetical protein
LPNRFTSPRASIAVVLLVMGSWSRKPLPDGARIAVSVARGVAADSPQLAAKGRTGCRGQECH